jgi:hypothetical protein
MSKPHPTLQDSKVKKLHRHQKFASKTPCNFGNFFAVEITRSPVQNRQLGATGFFLVISDLKTCSTKHMHATHTYVCMYGITRSNSSAEFSSSVLEGGK